MSGIIIVLSVGFFALYLGLNEIADVLREIRNELQNLKKS